MYVKMYNKFSSRLIIIHELVFLQNILHKELVFTLLKARKTSSYSKILDILDV